MKTRTYQLDLMDRGGIDHARIATAERLLGATRESEADGMFPNRITFVITTTREQLGAAMVILSCDVFFTIRAIER